MMEVFGHGIDTCPQSEWERICDSSQRVPDSPDPTVLFFEAGLCIAMPLFLALLAEVCLA